MRGVGGRTRQRTGRPNGRPVAPLPFRARRAASRAPTARRIGQGHRQDIPGGVPSATTATTTGKPTTAGGLGGATTGNGGHLALPTATCRQVRPPSASWHKAKRRPAPPQGRAAGLASPQYRPGMTGPEVRAARGYLTGKACRPSGRDQPRGHRRGLERAPLLSWCPSPTPAKAGHHRPRPLVSGRTHFPQGLTGGV